ELEAKGIDMPFPKLFGKLADEILRKYALDEKTFMDSLARISQINYSNAKLNPLAQTRKWFMSFEQASMRGTETNPLIGGRLAVSDCSQVTDGAAVVILASEKLLGELGKNDVPYIKGYGQRTAPMLFDAKIKESEDCEYILPWTRQAVLDAYRRSGLSVDDIDAFETHDCFTSSEYMAISAFGITAPGKEYEAIESGRISITGDKPINPSGGLIGCGHPVGASGARMMLDCFRQVSGQAGRYQIDGARNCMMLNIGGTATTNYVYVIGK
ncbi:MAG: thiolase domain-containing protein, partial [Oscillospiraceae bacterium]|nr:thiolase domain-containing protein [Oscillospiraceae bacterium]